MSYVRQSAITTISQATHHCAIRSQGGNITIPARTRKISPPHSTLSTRLNCDYIVACAEGLSWTALAPFVRSARAHVPQAKLVLFINRLDPETRECLRDEGAELHSFDALFPEGKHIIGIIRKVIWRTIVWIARLVSYKEFRSRLLQRGGGLLLPRNQARFFHYRSFLEDCTIPGDRFLFCDARDLVFQSNPFGDISSEEILLTEEEASVPLEDNFYNHKWYRETYGHRALQLRRSLPVICAGAIGGGHTKLIELFKHIERESITRRHRFGADQAIVNHIGVSAPWSNFVRPNRGGTIWHLHGVDPNEIKITEKNEITDQSNHLYSVVHMYDRIPTTMRAVKDRWLNP